MLNVSHVTKKYGKLLACNDVDFHLDPGSVTVLLGPNGAGKSTIMKSIIGFLKYEGQITVGGFPNKTTDARKLLGYIPEMPALYPNLTVSEHLEFLARAYRMTNYREKADALLERFGIISVTVNVAEYKVKAGLVQRYGIKRGEDADVLEFRRSRIGIAVAVHGHIVHDVDVENLVTEVVGNALGCRGHRFQETKIGRAHV